MFVARHSPASSLACRDPPGWLAADAPNRLQAKVREVAADGAFVTLANGEKVPPLPSCISHLCLPPMVCCPALARACVSRSLVALSLVLSFSLVYLLFLVAPSRLFSLSRFCVWFSCPRPRSPRRPRARFPRRPCSCSCVWLTPCRCRRSHLVFWLSLSPLVFLLTLVAPSWYFGALSRLSWPTRCLLALSLSPLFRSLSPLTPLAVCLYLSLSPIFSGSPCCQHERGRMERA